MRHVRRIKLIVALGMVASWTLLLGARLADTFEDLREGPEPVDAQVEHALATPAVPVTESVALPQAPPTQPLDAVEELIKPPMLSVCRPAIIATPPGPPPAARLFQTFSVYRL